MSYTREDVLKATRNLTGKTIPVHVKLKSQQVVLAQPEMEVLLSAAELIAVGNCACREEGSKCENPLEVCLSVDTEARRKIADDRWREISLDEAMALLEETHRLGLVHMAYRRTFSEEPAPREIGFVCSCCSCCCWPLNGLRAFDYSDAITESAYVASYDESKCVACGACARRCPFGAFAIADTETAVFNQSKCFGCGLCVSTCPTRAIRFDRR
jgi:Pyruvate/2-oxoacid:ferredoxin oxidoreductase delta subunit